MPESTTTSNRSEIRIPTSVMSAEAFRSHVAHEFGIDGDNPQDRIEQLKELATEGLAIFLEDLNKTIQGSSESLVSQDKIVRIGGKETIGLEDRYDVFSHLVDTIKTAPSDLNPARIADTLALGVVLLHPFKDGNGRTARALGLMFRDEYDSQEYEEYYDTVIEPRDQARARGGYMINGYVPKFPDGFDQSDPKQVRGYLEALLEDERPGQYTGCFGEASLAA